VKRNISLKILRRQPRFFFMHYDVKKELRNICTFLFVTLASGV
jgi:hypothetical protein